MAWNQPGDNQGKARRDNASLDETLRRWRQRLAGGGSGDDRARLIGYGALVVLALWAMTGIYQIDPPERGVVQRFGRFVAVTNPGARWHMPWPIESVTKVNVSSVNSIDYQSRMLTSDVNLVNISCAIQYRNADPQKLLFQVRDPDTTLREVSESAIREIIGRNTLDSVLAGEPRRAITVSMRDLIQKTIDDYGTGVQVLSVNLTDVQVPEQVLPSQRDFNKAIEDRERFSKEAQAYSNDILPKAQGNAQRQLLDAAAYKLQVVNGAQGDAARFSFLVEEYLRAPEVTRNRLYIETMETVLGRSKKVVIDAKSGSSNLLYLPLDKLTEMSGRSDVTVTATPTTQGSAATAVDSSDARSRERGDR